MNAKQVRVSPLDIATLLHHVYRGVQNKDTVGFEDCERTLLELTKELAPRRSPIPQPALESALWSCNLMDEIGEWWSPTGETFEQFVARVLRYSNPEERSTFDRVYNRIKLKQETPIREKLLAAVDQLWQPNCRKD